MTQYITFPLSTSITALRSWLARGWHLACWAGRYELARTNTKENP